MMSKQTFLHIIQWSIAIAACIFLVWEIATYDDYPALRASMQAMGWTEWIAIGACIVLMPVNMALEAWRWKTLASVVDSFNMSWKEAQRQVYYSKLAGIITPWRLGEYPARALLMNDETSAASPFNERSQGELNDALWAKVLSMGAVGSATMTAAIVIAGVMALVFNPSIMAKLGDSYLHALAAVALVLTVGFALAPKALKKYAEVNGALVITSIGQSLIRLLCWCVQLGLVLYALGAISNQPSVVSLLFIYYLLVTITPNVPIAEVGIRGAWAILIFGNMNAALAGVLLWTINTLLPCLIGLFLQKKSE